MCAVSLSTMLRAGQVVACWHQAKKMIGRRRRRRRRSNGHASSLTSLSLVKVVFRVVQKKIRVVHFNC